MKSVFLVIFCFLFSASFAQKKNSLSSFAWLCGDWKEDKTGNFETWRIVNDTMMTGIESHKDEDGEMIVDEIIRLVIRGRQFYYIPLVPNQSKGEEVEFQIVLVNKTEFKAENRQHDFPQQIVYKIGDGKKLATCIEGKANGINKRIDFLFIRQ